MPVDPLTARPRSFHQRLRSALGSSRRAMARAVTRIGPRRATLAAAYALLLVSCESPFAPDDGTVARIETNPLSVTLTVGETRPISARVLDDGGKALDNRRLFWSSQNPAIASVSQAGIVTGVANGSTQIAVSAGGKSGLIPITVNPRPVSLVRVTPSPVTIVAGATAQLSAEALDAGGATVTGRPVIWSTSSATIATVSSTGLVSAVAAGTANVTATIDGVQGSSVLTVQPVPVASLTLTPATGTIIVGQSLQLAATPRDAIGNALAGRAIAWSSNDPTVASVSSTGLVTALSRGTATITATSEGQSATSRFIIALVPVDTVTVTPTGSTIAAGQRLQLAARVVDSVGTLLTGRTIVWNTDQPSIATVDASGLVTGIASGRATISATVDGKTGVAIVNVTPVPVASLSITPGSGALTIGGTLQLTASARDASNNVLPGRSITWISGAPSVATVSQGGLVTAVGNGSALIFAASEGVAASITITVTSVGVASVRVTPSPASVQQGRTVQLTGEALDAGGAVLPGRTVIWNSASPTIASVSSTGLVTGIAVGTANITATVDGVVGTVAVTVTPSAVARVSIVPGSPVMTVGTQLTLTALLFDASGNPLSTAGRTINWVSTDPAVVSINAQGVLTAFAPGAVLVTVAADTATSRTIVTVTNVPVATVSLSPSTVNLQQGQTANVSATARDASGAILTGRPVTWTSSAPAVATVNTSATGGTNTITAVGAGSATIRATIGGVQGVATVTVTSVPIASIAVTPSPATVQELQTLQLTGTARDAGGNVLLGRTLVWSSSDNATASVSQTGLVTANVPGTVTISASAPNQGTGGSTPSGSTTLTVSYAPVAAAAISPSNVTVTAGSTPTQLAATLTASGGQTLSSTGRTITWSVSTNPSGAATISATGLLTGVSAGTGTITVTASSPGQATPVTATAPLTITTISVASVRFVPFTGTLRIGSAYARTLQAQALDASGAPLAGRLITWSTVGGSSNISFSQSSTTTGLVTITGNNTPAVTSVVATAQGASAPVADTIPITTEYVVISPTLSTVALSAAQADSVVPGIGQTRSYTATPRDSAGNGLSGSALGGRTPTWSLSPGTFATVAPSGATATVTPNSPGTVAVQADYGTGVLAPPSLHILTPVNAVTLTVAPDSFFVGGSGTVLAQALDAGSNPIAGRVIQLSSSAPATATLGVSSGTGSVSTQLTGVSAPGGRASVTVTATATLDGKSNTATARVLAPVATVNVTAPSDSIFVTTNVQATATLLDASGNTLAGRPIAWSTGDATIATVAQTGVVTGLAAGSTSIIATVEGKTGNKTLLVQEPVSTVSITAPDSSIFVTQGLTTTVTLRDRLNNVLSGRVVTYSSSNSQVATISATGVITTNAPTAIPGTTVITATSEGKSASFTLTTSLVPVASVTVSASPTPNVYPSHTFPATVVAFDSIGGVLSLSGRVIAWSSSSTTFVSVTPGIPGSASLRANAVGVATISVTVDGVAPTTPVTITVQPVPVDSVRISPTLASIQVGGTQTFAGTAIDSAGGVLIGRTITFTSTSTGKATVDATTGLATGIDSGTVNIVATAVNQGFGGKSPAAQASLIVTLVPINAVVISPSSETLTVGATKTLTLAVTNAGGGALAGRACSISSSRTNMVTVTPATALTDVNGLIALTITGVGIQPGNAPVVSATCEGVASNNVTVTVQ